MWFYGNGEGKEPDLVLAIDPGLYSPTLYQRNDLLLDLLDGPPKRSAHPLELDSGEGLEGEHHGPVPNKVRQVMYMGAEVDINVVTGLIHHVSQTIVSRKEGSTNGVPRQELRNSLEVTVHVGFDQLPNIRLLLNISPKDRVLKNPALDCRTREAGESAEGAKDRDIARGYQLHPPRQRIIITQSNRRTLPTQSPKSFAGPNFKKHCAAFS